MIKRWQRKARQNDSASGAAKLTGCRVRAGIQVGHNRPEQETLMSRRFKKLPGPDCYHWEIFNLSTRQWQFFWQPVTPDRCSLCSECVNVEFILMGVIVVVLSARNARKNQMPG